MKDYLQGSLTATTFGTPLSFRLSHLMAQISVTLKPGIGYTAEDLSQNVTVHLYGLHTLTNEGVETDGTLILSKEAASSPLKMNKAAEANAEGNFTYTALVAPQTIVQGNLVARHHPHCTGGGQNDTRQPELRLPCGKQRVRLPCRTEQ